MIFVTTYTLRSHMSKADVKRLMDMFGQRGAATGEIANYVNVDGTGGFTIVESDDMNSAYADALAYSEFMTFTISPVLKIDDAVGPIFEYLG